MNDEEIIKRIEKLVELRGIIENTQNQIKVIADDMFNKITMLNKRINKIQAVVEEAYSLASGKK